MAAFIPAVMPAILSLLEKVIPDKQAAAEAKLKAMELAQQGSLAELDAIVKLSAAQTDVNKAEAASGNWFAASARPTILYVCAGALFYYYLGHPIGQWIVAVTHANVTVPELVLDDHLWELMMGMLGLGTMRTVEKVKGVA
jgi:hypothetical protein